MGNSEVGHLNIGAGRVTNQDLVRINLAIRDGSIFRERPWWKHSLSRRRTTKPVHFLGLVSDGGVHSHLEHLKALCDAAKKTGAGCLHPCLHRWTRYGSEGGLGYLRELQEHLKHSSGKIASIVGRYYAMDRDKRWERVKEAYDLLVSGHGTPATDPLKAIESSYTAGITDEFIKPIVITRPDGQPTAIIREGDVVICFNFRTDRCREITRR